MAAFSTRSSVALGCALLASACGVPGAPAQEDPADAPAHAIDEPAEEPARPPADPGEEGQSRTLLQHYRARDLAADQLAIPSGDRLGAEATAWQLPFQSKRIIAAFLTSLARGRPGELRHMLAPNATFGRPDPRRPHERPIFEDDNLIEFFDGVSAAAARFDASAKYVNPTSFLMGVQERIRSGAEPMWAYYEAGNDRLMFRFRLYGNRAYIDYVGFNPELPPGPVDYDALGPPPPMMPGVMSDEGEIIRNFDPAKMGARRQQAPGGLGNPARPTGQ